jgi:hypothetical protein
MVIPVTHTINGCNSQEELIRVIFLIIYIGIEISLKILAICISVMHRYRYFK